MQVYIITSYNPASSESEIVCVVGTEDEAKRFCEDGNKEAVDELLADGYDKRDIEDYAVQYFWQMMNVENY